ncbi:MAG: hypothetical protein ACLGI5_12685 [Thermoleophilia bacterium]
MPPPVDVLPPERDGGFVRSAEAGASLRATLGVLNPGALFAVSAVGAAAAGVLGFAAAGAAAGAGAATVNDAGAKPPVVRAAVIVYVPGVVGAVIDVVNPPPLDVGTVAEPVGPLTVMFVFGGKYAPWTVIALPGW